MAGVSEQVYVSSVQQAQAIANARRDLASLNHGLQNAAQGYPAEYWVAMQNVAMANQVSDPEAYLLRQPEYQHVASGGLYFRFFRWLMRRQLDRGRR